MCNFFLDNRPQTTKRLLFLERKDKGAPTKSSGLVRKTRYFHHWRQLSNEIVRQSAVRIKNPACSLLPCLGTIPTYTRSGRVQYARFFENETPKNRNGVKLTLKTTSLSSFETVECFYFGCDSSLVFYQIKKFFLISWEPQQPQRHPHPPFRVQMTTPQTWDRKRTWKQRILPWSNSIFKSCAWTMQHS